MVTNGNDYSEKSAVFAEITLNGNVLVGGNEISENVRTTNFILNGVVEQNQLELRLQGEQLNVAKKLG
ncbi:MAG: hypothetical protein ACI82A_001294 [Candidatus Azotimanducaceae bacterium]|jgi:hypothetical protein